MITEDPLHPSSATDSAQSSRPEVPRFKFLFNLDKITATLEWKNPPKNRRRATHSNANVADEPAPGEKLAYFELAGFHIDGAIMPNFMIQGEAAIQVKLLVFLPYTFEMLAFFGVLRSICRFLDFYIFSKSVA